MRDGARAFLPDAMPCTITQGCFRTGRVGHVTPPIRKEHHMGSDFKARRGLRAFVAVTVISIGLGGTLAGVADAAPPSNITRSQRGAQWLANQIKANHGFVKSFGAADNTSTAYAVIAMRATGVDKPASD